MKNRNILCESPSLLRAWMVLFCSGLALLGCGREEPPEQTPPPTPANSATPLPEIETSSSLATPPAVEQESTESEAIPLQTIFRPPNPEPPINQEAFEERGYRRYASEHLILYTDIEQEIAPTLVELVDQEYAALVKHFGPLPPARDEGNFRMIGYLMREREAVIEFGLLPNKYLRMRTGGHIGARFWMLDQETDYYRRHLLFHEATHCFMTVMPDTSLPKWYLEGMAELVATHRIEENGEITFGVLPEDKEHFAGWGRIKTIQNEVAAGRLKTISDLRSITRIDPVQEVRDYAWSWALCYFLDTHPRYRQRFRELHDDWRSGAFSEEFTRLFAKDMPELNLEWTLFVTSLMEGYDLTRGAMQFTADSGGSTAFIDAGKGWQSTDWTITNGETYRITAMGEVTLDDDPKPWISQPQGITLRYFDGQPLGRLVGLVVDVDAGSFSPLIDLGRERTWRASDSGTLFLRVNDVWNSLENNQGSYQVQMIEPEIKRN